MVRIRTAAGAFLMMVCLAQGQAADKPWIEPMKKVHAKFTGTKGTLAQFGDSITITMAYWAPLRSGPKNMSPEAQEAHKLVATHLAPDCWSKWKGPEYGNNGSMTIRWAHDNVAQWLQKHNPETAIIMFGTNDLTSVPLEEYEKKTREVVQRCLDNGTVVILTAIPPRTGMLEKSKKYAEAAAKVAGELNAPLCDYFGECLKRRSDDWDGAAEKFKEHKGYDVPTVIARDGVHPSNPKAFSNDFSEEGLRSNGYGLRNYASMMSYADVIRHVLTSK